VGAVGCFWTTNEGQNVRPAGARFVRTLQAAQQRWSDTGQG